MSYGAPESMLVGMEHIIWYDISQLGRSGVKSHLAVHYYPLLWPDLRSFFWTFLEPPLYISFI